MYPRPSSITAIPSDSQFTKAEISAQVQDRYNKGKLVLPMVVEGLSLTKGDQIDYRVDGYPWGGELSRVTNRGPQQLLLIEPTWLSTYEVTDAEAGFLATQGLLPKNVAYNNNVTDNGGGLARSTASASTKAFTPIGCGNPAAVQLAFSPYIKFTDPVDIGVKFALGITGQTITCKFIGNSDLSLAILGPFAKLAESGVGMVLKGLFGLNYRAFAYGSIEARLDSTQSSALGITAFARHKGELDYAFNAGFKAPAEVSDGLVGNEVKTSGAFGLGAGIGLALNLSDAGGVLGDMFQFFSLSPPSGGISGKAGLFGGLTAAATSPAWVRKYHGSANFQSEAQSSLGAKLNFEAKVEVSKSFESIIARILGAKPKLSLSIETPLLKAKFWDGSFIAGEVEERGQKNGIGIAGIKDVTPSNSFIEWLAGSASKAGFVFPSDSESSVFNDNAFQIDYDVQECDESDTGKIVAPVVGCIGAFCGPTQDIEVCGGESLEIVEIIGPETVRWNDPGKNIEIIWTGSPTFPLYLSSQLAYLDEGTNYIFNFANAYNEGEKIETDIFCFGGPGEKNGALDLQLTDDNGRKSNIKTYQLNCVD